MSAQNEMPKVLVVDDEKTSRLIAVGALEKHFQVTATHSPNEALQLLMQDFHQILVTDIDMEEMYGLELIQKAKIIYPDLLFIIMTAHGEKDVAIKAVQEGAFDFFEKPLAAEEFLLSVRLAWHTFQKGQKKHAMLLDMHQQNRELLVESQQLRGMLEAVYESVIVTDDQGTITEFNSSAEQLFGFSKDEAAGKRLGTFFGPEYQAYIETALVHPQKDAPARVIGLKKDQSQFVADLATGSWTLGKKKYVVATIRKSS